MERHKGSGAHRQHGSAQPVPRSLPLKVARLLDEVGARPRNRRSSLFNHFVEADRGPEAVRWCCLPPALRLLAHRDGMLVSARTRRGPGGEVVLLLVLIRDKELLHRVARGRAKAK